MVSLYGSDSYKLDDLMIFLLQETKKPSTGELSMI